MCRNMTRHTLLLKLWVTWQRHSQPTFHRWEMLGHQRINQLMWVPFIQICDLGVCWEIIMVTVVKFNASWSSYAFIMLLYMWPFYCNRLVLRYLSWPAWWVSIFYQICFGISGAVLSAGFKFIICFYTQPFVETFMRQYTTWSQLWSLSCYFHLMALIYSAAHSEVNALNDGIRSECHGYSVWMPRTKLQCMKCHWLLCLGFGIGEIIFVLVFVQRS